MKENKITKPDLKLTDVQECVDLCCICNNYPKIVTNGRVYTIKCENCEDILTKENDYLYKVVIEWNKIIRKRRGFLMSNTDKKCDRCGSLNAIDLKGIHLCPRCIVKIRKSNPSGCSCVNIKGNGIK